MDEQIEAWMKEWKNGYTKMEAVRKEWTHG